MSGLKLVHLDHKKEKLSPVDHLGPAKGEQVSAFHRSFPEYAPTPLVKLDRLADRLNLKGFYVKDESFRFGLNAFKVLGGSWAVGRCIAQRLGEPIENLPCGRLTSQEIREKLGALTFVTATDGNHGRGVAWTAARLGQRSVVYMPRGTAQERLDNIRALGSDASITDLCYDDAVRLARKMEQEKGWILVQDTAWEGYEEIPGWIMEGYTTMAKETAEQLNGVKPTHIFLQAGVGSLAGALTAYFAALWGEDRPVITIVEPHSADCIFRTAEANDGQLRFVTGEMDTIMAGLACGEPCTTAWEILRDHADNFISMPDRCAARAMRVLGNPLPGDARIISGESGASGVGAVLELLMEPGMEEERKMLGLDEHSVVLCFSTEGDTDRENYRKIVWDGAFPNL